MYIYVSAIDGQTAKPNGLTFQLEIIIFKNFQKMER